MNGKISRQMLQCIEFPHSLPTPLSWSGSWEYGDEYTTKRKRQVKTVVNRWIWPHDGTDQAPDVDSKRANCSIPSVPMTNRWTMVYWSFDSHRRLHLFFLLCSGARTVLMVVIRDHHPGQANL
ncbi:hypothetical protein T10_5157 [Trichinella papuae]|uniref:Uncharacterized protein n=1 Tax=Trichinella papuae TaxID=268474 RepID=A0A0V1M5N5_9BILA|nr:hypothetical protein T10_5157 [Trichinella papuae]